MFNRKMRQIGRAGYFFRHLRNFLPYLTPVKVYNLGLNIIELRRKVLTPRSLPPYIKIEPTPLCQLRCPGCPQSDPLTQESLKATMHLSMDSFRGIVDPLAKTLLGISLSNTGEPMLNKDLTAMIAYAHKRRIAVSFPSNFSFSKSDKQLEELVLSGLDAMQVSLDGASAETYEQYRIGGRFDRVLHNVKTVSEIKKRLGLKRPRMIWKFVTFDHNKHEVPEVSETYKELGFDAYEIVIDKANVERVKSFSDTQTKNQANKKSCYWLYHTMVMRWDGNVDPCCRGKNFKIGNAITTNVVDIWRGENYRRLRAGFSDDAQISDIHPECRACLGLPRELSEMAAEG